MTTVKVWCERCCGTGNYDGNDYSCTYCQGKGYIEWSIEQLASPVTVSVSDINFSCAQREPEYTIDDAEVDAKVLEALHGFIIDGTSMAGEVASTIINRLHAFYVGEK